MASDAEVARLLGEQYQAQFEVLAKDWRAGEEKYNGDGYDEEESYRLALAISQQDDFELLLIDLKEIFPLILCTGDQERTRLRPQIARTN